MTDAVDRILAIVDRVAPLGEARALAEQQLRRELGGERVRIEARPPVTLERIDAGLRARRTVVQIAADMGVSRATIYRHLGRKSRRP